MGPLERRQVGKQARKLRKKSGPVEGIQGALSRNEHNVVWWMNREPIYDPEGRPGGPVRGKKI